MIRIPNKGFFEKEHNYIKRLAEAFETDGHLDPINAHYAATFWFKAKCLKSGEYKKTRGADLVLTAIKKLINDSGDVTDPSQIESVIAELNGKHPSS